MSRILGCMAVGLLSCNFASHAHAAFLLGVVGNGGNNPESLNVLSQVDGSTTFARNLGNGTDGEAIAYNTNDGLLYHASGFAGGNNEPEDLVFESIDPMTGVIINIDVLETLLTGITDPDTGIKSEGTEVAALTYWPGGNTFLTATIFSNGQLLSVTPTGSVSFIGDFENKSKGLAFTGNSLYSVTRNNNLISKINPLDASTISSMPIINVDPLQTILGVNGLATHPDTGVLWATVKIAQRDGNGDLILDDDGNPIPLDEGRVLVTIDPVTGDATSIGNTGDFYAGLAFAETVPVPEPSTMLLTFLGFAGLMASVKRMRD